MRSLLLISLLSAASYANAQYFYDLEQIQQIRIYFPFNDWDYQLDTAKAGADSYLLADSVFINGKKFESCGVKFKGNSSYDASRIKNPLHIKLDYVKNADYQGFENIKLGNAWSDNAMIREPLCYAILRQYMDAPRGNFARVYINGEYYGLMNNAESIDKNFLLDHFYSSKYEFYKCNPISIGSGLGNGPNLAYLGADLSNYYNKYELESDTGWTQLINFCDTLNNHYEYLNDVADVDRLIWMLAFNNAMVNLDSYSGAFRQNYYLYRNHRQQWIPIVWDLNMCIGGFSVAGGTAGALTPATMQTMNYTLHKSESGWPLIYKLLNDQSRYKMYLAHLRTINNENFANGQYKTLANTLHSLVDPEVQNDPNFLSTYADFQVSLSENTPGTNGAGISPGIFTLLDARAAYLSNVLSATPPQISNVTLSQGNYWGEIATVTAEVSNATAVYLGYRLSPAERFLRVPMYDDGAHNDGAAGDLRYGAEMPLLSLQVQYFLYAENASTGAFSPERAEHEFYSIAPMITQADPGQVVINEATSNNDESIENEKGKVKDWIELFNTSNVALGLYHLYLSNDTADLTKWPFPVQAFIAPQEHLLVWADDLDTAFLDLHCNFDLNKLGDRLLLTDGTHILDQAVMPALGTDQAFARCPDGSGNFNISNQATPRKENQCVSGVGEAASNAPLRLFPNPANQSVQLESEWPIQSSSLWSTDGRLLSQGIQRFDLSGLPAGAYWVCVRFENGVQAVRKLVKE